MSDYNGGPGEPAEEPENTTIDPWGETEPTTPVPGLPSVDESVEPPAPPPPSPYPSAYQPRHQPDPAPLPMSDPTSAPAPGSAPSHSAPSPWMPVRSEDGPGAPATSTRQKGVPGWLWPAVTALALVVGLVGGAVGGVAVQAWQDRSDEGLVSGGLSGVDTVSQPPLDEANGSVAAVAQALLPSTVQIVAQHGGQSDGATGSGFVLDRQGHIVTNNHVVAGASDGGDILVVDHNGKRHEATIVGRSPVYDLAVLNLTDGPGDLVPAALGHSKALHVGEGVVAIGSPLGLTSTVTSGIVSALNRPVSTGDSDNESSFINAVQTDAAINPGNSGGPLVNLAGQVVGVNSAIAVTGGGFGADSGNIGVGFAIPVEQVRITADQILADGKAYYPVIGAQVQTGGRSEYVGATIREVNAGSPSEAAGLQAGDLVTAVGDHRVTDGIGLIVAIRTFQPGAEVDFTVERDGEEQTITIKLGSEVG